ncbi:hypothetical protein AN958_00034 [Leucoagaricus sp. SymC.cos]|nr:hypothetical protein AN958_00034 [Leucoagaricus sp. SymC.cos]
MPRQNNNSTTSQSQGSSGQNGTSTYSCHKAYGGAYNFMHSYGLKVEDMDAYTESEAITDALKAYDKVESDGGNKGKK